MNLEGEFEIDQPDFKATRRQKGFHKDQEIEYRVCYELVGGKWEGFVSVRGLRRHPKPESSKRLARSGRKT